MRSCTRRGAAIDLVLAAARESRSQVVFTKLKGGREGIFWQSSRTTKQARPGVRIPGRRASWLRDFTIVVDTRERYPYKFTNQQVAIERHSLRVGDYGVDVDGEFVAAVERKSLDDLVHGLIDGSIQYQLADLASLDRSAVVVEDRYSKLFKIERTDPGGSPISWLASRCDIPRCRSCSARHARSRRNGRFASLVPRSPARSTTRCRSLLSCPRSERYCSVSSSAT